MSLYSVSQHIDKNDIQTNISRITKQNITPYTVGKIIKHSKLLYF